MLYSTYQMRGEQNLFTTSKGIRMYVPSAQDAHQDEWYYLFRDEEHGEEFFVRARSY